MTDIESPLLWPLLKAVCYLILQGRVHLDLLYNLRGAYMEKKFIVDGKGYLLASTAMGAVAEGGSRGDLSQPVVIELFLGYSEGVM